MPPIALTVLFSLSGAVLAWDDAWIMPGCNNGLYPHYFSGDDCHGCHGSCCPGGGPGWYCVDNNLQVQDNGSYDDAYIHEGCDTGRDVNVHYSWACAPHAYMPAWYCRDEGPLGPVGK